MAKWFKPSEVKGLDGKLVYLLDQIREMTGIPMRITRGLQTKKQNAAVGGKVNSAHLKGLAADIACADSTRRYALLEAMFTLKIPRIEVATRHLHIDVDPTKPQDVVFLGISS